MSRDRSRPVPRVAPDTKTGGGYRDGSTLSECSLSQDRGDAETFGQYVTPQIKKSLQGPA